MTAHGPVQLPAPAQHPVLGPRTVRYHYREVVDQVYDPSSIGVNIGPRELQIQVDWWASVTTRAVGTDSLAVSATIDSGHTRWIKQIPEYPIEMSPTLGQGGHVTATVARGGGLAGLHPRSEADRLLAFTLLPVLVPALEGTAGASVSDTVDAGQPVRRLRRSVPALTAGFWPDEPNPSAIHTTLVQDVDADGVLVAARLRKEMHMAVPIGVVNGTELRVAGTGTWTATIERMP